MIDRMAETRTAATAAPVHGRHGAAAEDARDSVVVVHGLWMPGWETLLLRRRLQADGYRTYSFAYPTIGASLDENAAQLSEFAEALPGRRVHFVGHSLGGVLIVRLFERLGFARAGRIVCLGSPLTGTHAGRMLGAFPLGRHVAGPCIHELVECGGCQPWGGACDLGIIAGDIPLGFGRFLGGLEKPHDGTVSVSETRLAGATEHAVLHCTHMSMLWSPTVAEYVRRFLREGRF
jgi:pimeloyl-ACP methyl ester carboxylesterase